MSSFPICIPTTLKKVVLRQLVLRDVPDYWEAIDQSRDHLSQFGDNTADKYPDITAVVRSIERSRNPNRLRFGIHAEKVFVGGVNLEPRDYFGSDVKCFELGYWLRAGKTGQGYATVAAEALTRYAFDTLEFQMGFALVHPSNLASIKVLSRIGYKVGQTVGDQVAYEKFMQS